MRRDDAGPATVGPDPARQAGSSGWFSANAMHLHAIMLLGVALCTFAAWFEWTRALSGHEIAWAYCFEWPLFGVLGIHIWWRLLHAELNDQRASDTPREAATPRRQDTDPALDDPDLVAWQAYLARLHAADPPGGPPTGTG